MLTSVSISKTSKYIINIFCTTSNCITTFVEDRCCRVHTHPAQYFFLTFPDFFLEKEGVFLDYISEIHNIFSDQLVPQMMQATDPPSKTK